MIHTATGRNYRRCLRKGRGRQAHPVGPLTVDVRFDMLARALALFSWASSRSARHSGGEHSLR